MTEANWLYASAVLIALIHTALGPDHYLPFVAMSRAGRWSLRKTMAITALCGVGHVLGSIVLGFMGLAMGLALTHVEQLEKLRGAWAAWLLLGFGLAYLIWGLRHALRNKPHAHLHAHADGTVHSHEHAHHAEHLHVHQRCETKSGPWILFTIFLFGPCEPLIPLLMYPAAKGNLGAVLGVTVLFGVITVTSMVILVTLALGMLPNASPARFSRFGHALAGLVITACGAAMQMGL